MSGTGRNVKGRALGRLESYRQLKRAIPGLDNIYTIIPTLIHGSNNDTPSILIIGAGGGREIEVIKRSGALGQVTAIDPSAENLNLARAVTGSDSNIKLINGTMDILPHGETFDIITSLFVMHHLPDDCEKLEYLRSIKKHLAKSGVLIHADACLEEARELERLVSYFEATSDALGIPDEIVSLELSSIKNLPLISEERTYELFAQSEIFNPQVVFRTLWYRCWVGKNT
ncbi:class I SAM-dependent methyltransferase [Epibacterium sp. Ofav1-8]|uniref:class I SAM-dependent methyltransferase n=1 Tax=Epibacterium sp. Ofav1-8 TaxID=2917735 RepID=UPI001EF62774|nr:class I SAM-dependent methyltransferase [Epibacterium sp. Ofav1-8]MCG7625182.1 class I SAM-dependent methyltransferase [Epibacterium sp. Ofav1-8]